MKKVKITANELDQAEDWLKNIDSYSIEDVPMLLASYGRTIQAEMFPSLMNLSEEINTLAKSISGIKQQEYVTLSLYNYNELRDFKRRAMVLIRKLTHDNKIIPFWNYDELIDLAIKNIEEPEVI